MALRLQRQVPFALLRRITDREAEADQMVADDLAAEPTRSVLHRSAPSLAIECGELQIAERLIVRAFAGVPPVHIAEELKDLFMQINLRNYLTRQGIELTNAQMPLLPH